jgi:hypothetical protein
MRTKNYKVAVSVDLHIEERIGFTAVNKSGLGSLR